MRRVHAQNRVSAPQPESIQRDRMRLRAATYGWMREHGTQEQRGLAFRRLMRQWLLSFPTEQRRCTRASAEAAIQLSISTHRERFLAGMPRNPESAHKRKINA